MADLAKLKQLYGPDVSDEEAVTRAAKEFGIPITDIAAEVGYKTGGKWGSAASGAVDTMQSQAYDAAEAAATKLGWGGVAEGAKKRRKQNEAEAEIHQAAAAKQGLTTEFSDIRGVGDVGEFIGSTAVGSAPQMGVGLAGAAAGAATGAAIGSAVPVIGTAIGGAVGGAIGYGASQLPLYFGANRQAQREQTRDLPGGERVDDTSAFLAAGGQTGLDMLGGGPVAGVLRRAGTKLGAKVVGESAKDVIEKTAGRAFSPTALAKDFAVGGIKEGAYSEIPQQVLEEYARGAVDPNHDLLGLDAGGRYLGAAAGALALGGPINTVTGAMGRAKANKAAPEKGSTPIGEKGTLGESLTDYGDTSILDPANRTDPLNRNTGVNQRIIDNARLGQPPPGQPPAGPSGPAEPDRIGGLMLGGERDRVNQSMLDRGRTIGADSVVGAQAAQQVEQTLGAPVQAKIDEKTAAAAPLTPEQQKQTAIDKVADQHAQQYQAVTEEAIQRGVPEHGLEAYRELAAARDLDAVNDDEFARMLGLLKSGDKKAVKQVEKLLQEVEQRHLENEAKKAAAPAAGLSPGRSALAAFTNKETGKPMSEQARDRAFLILGLDEEGHPVGDPLTLQDVAEIEHRAQGKTGPVPDNKKALKAISKQLNEFGLDLDARRALYKQIHGEDMPLEGAITAEGDEALQEGEEVEVEPQHQERVTDSDQSEQQGAVLDYSEAGEGGSMRLVDSASKNVAVEEVTSEQRADALNSLIAGPGYNDAQKEAFKQALGSGKTYGSAAGAKKLMADTANFSEDELKALKVLFEHGKTTKAAAGRRARVEAVVARLTGEMSEHDRQVRERQQAANNARLAQEELVRAQRKAEQEGGLEELDKRLDEDGRTLRMHLMDKNKLRQARLIGESLADAKAAYAQLFADHAKEKDPNDHLPPWEELTPREQGEFVKMWDTYNYEKASEPEHVAQGKIAGKAYEAQEGHAQRKAEEGRQEARQAKRAEPTFQADVKENYEAETRAETQRIIEESKARAQQRKEKKTLTLKAKPKAEPAAAPQEKPDGQQASPESVSPPKPEPVEAKAAPRVHRRASKPAVQAVVGGGTATAGEEVSKGSARGASDATAGAPHGPGPVRGEDGQAAAAPGAEADRESVESESDIAYAPAVAESLRELGVDTDELEGGVKLFNEKWVPLEEAVDAALLGMSPREQAMPFQYYHVLGIAPTHWDQMIKAVQARTESPELQNIERLNAARDESPAPLTVTAPAAAGRTPSVTRVVRRVAKGLEEGTVSPEAFAAQASAALDAADAARAAKVPGARLRGADRIMEVLLAARRNGELDAQGVEMALWFIRQNPQAVANLGISVRAATKREGSVSGAYNPVDRIVTLMKGSLNTETAVHEILHHLERMMPTHLQNAIRREWAKSIGKGYANALKAGNESLTRYYEALMHYHFYGRDTLARAEEMLASGEVGYEHYQNFNPSEFWAVNGSRIVAGRHGVSGSILGQIKQYLREFVQMAKSVLGLKSDHAVIRALDSMARADGNFTSGLMLQDQPGAHFMYAGQKTADQERLNQLNRYHWMRAGGATPTSARLATGWFRNPVDNEMRYEFSDHTVKFKAGAKPLTVTRPGQKPVTRRLDEVIDHPELFLAYPEARTIKVSRQVAEDGTHGWFDPNQNMVVVTNAETNPLSTILHEVQHWVQVKEGFAVGGSPEEVTHAMSPEQRVRLYMRASAEMAKPGYQSHLDEADRQQLEIMLAGNLEPDPAALALYAAGTHALVRAYRHIAGEIEARDTQARMQMTPQQRQDTTPLTSEKVAMKDVVTIRDGAGIGKSVEPPAQRYQNIEAVRRAAVERVPARARPAVDTMSRMIGNSTKSLIKGLTFTRDLLQMAERGLGPAAADYLRLEEGRNATKIAHLHAADVVVAAHKKLSVAERAGVNAYLKKSTMEAKWGYRPDHFSAEDKAKVKVDPALEAIWKNTLNDAQRAVVKEVFKHGHETLTTMKTLVNLNVAAEFQAAIAQARAANDDKQADKLQADMDDQLAHFKTLLAVGEYHPYAPLKRFGNHVVVGKSQRYMDAEAALEANADDKAARKALREMQSNADHYYVSMHETQHEAQQERDRIAGQYDQADTMEKDRGYLNEVGGNRGMMGMFHRLRGQAEREGGNLDKKAQQATDRLLTDLYLSLLSETSARQSERERKNVAGADEDMMRAFHSKGRADANFLASLATGGAMQDALNAMEKEAGRNGMVNGTTREERHAHYREILSRHVMGMDYKQSPAVDFALKSSSVMQLLTNPAYHLTNLLQPYVMSVPTLAGRFGMVKSMGAMMAAHRELGGRLFKNGVDHSSIEDLPSDVRKGVQALMDKGLINMSLDSEHGAEWNEGKLGKPIGWLKRVSERIEAVNRVATGVAALRLADKAGLSEQAAVNYAAKIIYDTHGDYSGFNTPSLMRAPVARLITQYRKFQLIQLHNYTRMVRDGFLNANLSKEEKWVARKALAYNLSTMFALGGTLALPGAQAVGAILRAIFGDDDEPDDPELTMRKYLSEAGLEGISDLLVKGVPAWLGVDVSGRLGAGNIASLFPYADISDKGKSSLVSRKAFEAYALAATGPFIGGLAPKLADGLHDWSNGDPYKGTEKLMPSGLGNMLKGARIATQGVTMKSGDTVMDADQVGFLAGLGQAVGLPTTTVTERGQRGQALRNMDLFYKDKVSQIKREYVQAYRDGDAEKLAEARSDWAEVGQRMKAHDLQPPKVSDLVKAPHAQAKKDKSLIEGVQTSKRTAGAARQLAELY